MELSSTLAFFDVGSNLPFCRSIQNFRILLEGAGLFERIRLFQDLLDGGEVEDATSLRFLNNSLRDLLGLWFSGGMMSLERITWQSSCEVLERIAQYEAVHPVRHWTDIKHRVGPYRRCFVFTHSCMPNEPVVVLHTALMDQIGNNVQVKPQTETRTWHVLHRTLATMAILPQYFGFCELLWLLLRLQSMMAGCRLCQL